MVVKAVAKTSAPRRMKRAEIGMFLTAISGGNADPRTELDYATPYMLLVAVVLSAQTTDVAVNKVTKALFAAAPDPAAMAGLGAAGIGPYIRSIGLWQAKAKNVAALSELLIARHGGEVPGDREALEALPGVGRKTANVVLNEIFGQATMAVDTHIFRLGNRTGIAPGTTPRQVEDGLLKRVPKFMLKPAHLWLILHGRYICKARSPECWRCGGARYCVFKPKTLAPISHEGRTQRAKKRPVG
jgi:endonuclease-3